MRDFNIFITDKFHLLNKILFVLQLFPWLRLMDRIARGVATDDDNDVLATVFQQWWFYGTEYGDFRYTKYDWLILLAYKRYGHTWSDYGMMYNFSITYRIYTPHGDYEIWLVNSGHKVLFRCLGTSVTCKQFLAMNIVPFDTIQYNAKRLYYSMARDV